MVVGLGGQSVLADGPQPTAVVDPQQQDVLAQATKRLNLKACRVMPVTVSITSAGALGAATSGSLSFEVTPGTVSTFTLEPYALRDPEFRFQITDDTGTHDAVAPASTTYRGVNAEGDEAWVSIYKGEVNGFVRRAAAPLNLVYIQPALETNPAPGANGGLVHAVYLASDVIPTNHTCGNDQCAACQQFASSVAPSRFEPRGVLPPCRYIRMNIDCDFPMFQLSGYDYGRVVQSVESVMLGVNQAYVAASFLADPRFTIKQLTIRGSAATEPYSAIPYIDGSINDLLNTATSQWSATASTRELTHVFSGRDATGSTIGLAWVGAICTNNNVGVSETYFNSSLASRQSLTAHEMGHNFGMNHEAEGVMTPSVSSPASLTFGPNAVTSFNTYLTTKPTCGAVPLVDVQPDAGSTIAGRSIRIDVLANDGRSSLACASSVTSFTLPSTTTTLGGSCTVSVGTGPGGRNQVQYTPPTGVNSGTDSFNYVASATTVPVTVQILTPRAPDGNTGSNPGLDLTFYDTRPDFMPNFYWQYDLPPTDIATYPTLGSSVLTQLNYPSSIPGMLIGTSARISSYINIPTTGYWTFTLAVGSSARLSIGGEPFLLAPYASGGTTVSASRPLAAGLHALRVDYHYRPSSSKLQLSYNLEGQASAIIPASAYFRTATTVAPCRADFDQNGSRNIDDIFIFLNAWFNGCNGTQSGSPCFGRNTDVDGVNGVNIDDIFIFINIWFAGCP
jgi:hypothetical protein